jgi:hypothetical protein
MLDRLEKLRIESYETSQNLGTDPDVLQLTLCNEPHTTWAANDDLVAERIENARHPGRRSPSFHNYSHGLSVEESLQSLPRGTHPRGLHYLTVFVKNADLTVLSV